MMEPTTLSNGSYTPTGVASRKPVAPKMKLFGVILGMSLGTGSEGIWAQGQRAEPVKAAPMTACNLATVSVLRKVRRISGLTWDELSKALNVSRRTVHNWDAGEVVRQKHLRRLYELAALIERLDTGNPVQLRNLILEDLGGRSALVMLKEGRYLEVESLLRTSRNRYSTQSMLSEGEARVPEGVSLASYGDEQSVRIIRGKPPLKAVKTPKLRKA